MQKKTYLGGAAALSLTLASAGSCAAGAGDGHDHHHGHHHHQVHGHGAHKTASHNRHDHADAPIGVMGDHTAPRGEWMLSYRSMRMEMEGSRIGTDSITPEEIVATVPSLTGAPPTLRVVPTSMTMDMHMFGAMYGLTDKVSVMGMVSYLDSEMDHVTFAGMAGTTERGTFTTRSKGIGDTRVSALWTVSETGGSRTVLAGGLSLPTGSIDETDDVLTPMGTTPTLTLPYPMQLGSGAVDPFVSATHAGNSGKVGWGVQGSALVRLYDNDEDYRRGDEFKATAWASYSLTPAVSASARVAAQSIGSIDGQDARINAPVQTAAPDFHGGERVDAAIGVSLAGQTGALRGHRFSAEIGRPIYQDLNGPQLETDLIVTLGWRYAV